MVTLGEIGRHMCEGEFESLKAIYEVSPDFVPKPYAWGKYSKEDPETYFLLAEFRDVGQQVRLSRFTHVLGQMDRTLIQRPIVVWAPNSHGSFNNVINIFY